MNRKRLLTFLVAGVLTLVPVSIMAAAGLAGADPSACGTTCCPEPCGPCGPCPGPCGR